ncbi:WxL protein peptidoglycan domain-containing protein [Cellulomonas sp. KRMCY2]|uniref:WxL protein peptidoglycan domain-containing protein n=1 Tax=Cellulomonas sp. KRMCY2 TaxID=1304865 RepID=UPI00045E9076|nr:DUF916 domain-containing protein [Cellulomonas sp. KRMCY2]
MTRQLQRALGASVLALGLAWGAVVGLPTTAAYADDSTASWSATPADANGLPDGQTRYELELDAGQSVEQHVLITNSSTVEREFAVYAADAFSTPSGGYDVSPAATPPTEVGAWVTPAGPTVTIGPLATATVAFTVAVPADATPGDHPGGIVVSPVRAQVTETGVVVDTRVAVRLNVRVPGEIIPALEVRRVGGDYALAGVPFASAATTVTYEVVNTGNVKVNGVPRVRVTGPFGIELAEVEADETREVLPGDSFMVTTVLDRVAPVGVATVVVDVAMAAAPGPATEIPLVSSTARTTMLAISWTGLAIVLLVAAAAWLLVRRIRTRRARAGHWATMLDEARREAEAGAEGARAAAGSTGSGPAARALGAALTLGVTLALGVGGLVLGAPPAHADESDEGALSLTVPGAPSKGTTTTTGSGTGTTPRSRGAAGPAGVPTEPGATSDEPGAVPGAGEVTATADGLLPDLLWALQSRRWSPVQWTLVGLGGAGALAGLGLVGRGFLIGRRGMGAAS